MVKKVWRFENMPYWETCTWCKEVCTCRKDVTTGKWPECCVIKYETQEIVRKNKRTT